MSNGFVDTFERNGRTANMHDTDLRNTIGQANGLAQLDSNGKLPSSQMPSDTTKADKVNGATNGNLAGLDANGNLTDAGWSSSKTVLQASGNPISIPGLKSNQLAKDPVITFEPIQAGSGDPSPSNVRAISGYDKIEVVSTGKNLLNKSNFRLDYNYPQLFSISSSYEDAVLLKPNTEYHVKIHNPWTYSRIWGVYYDNGVTENVWGDGYSGDNRATTEFVFTSSNYARHFIVVFGGSNGNWVPVDVSTAQSGNVVLCENTQSITYEPYNKTTDLSLQLGQTIYGGTLDVETGVLTVDRGIDDLANHTWYEYAGRYYTIDLNSLCPQFSEIIAERYKRASEFNTMTENSIVMQDNLYVLSSESPTGKLVYPLATPYTIQLTPHEISLLKDYTYVSTNGTNMQFSYKNGEMALLADVSQLGQTVNELGDVVNYRTPVHMLKIFEHYVNDLYFYLPIWWDIQYGGYIVDSLLVNNSQNNFRYNFTLRWYNGTVDKTYETLNDSPSDNLTFTVLW